MVTPESQVPLLARAVDTAVPSAGGWGFSLGQQSTGCGHCTWALGTIPPATCVRMQRL